MKVGSEEKPLVLRPVACGLQKPLPSAIRLGESLPYSPGQGGRAPAGSDQSTLGGRSMGWSGTKGLLDMV